MFNLSYQAESAEEFRELCVWMRDNGFGDKAKRRVEKPSPSPSDSNGPNVARYIEETGNQRFRISQEEKTKFGNDREAAAAARLEEMGITVSEQTSDTSDTPPQDDGGDLY